MPPQLSDRLTLDVGQRQWLIGLGFSVRPGDASLSLPLGDSFNAWRLYVQPVGERWMIARHDPYACCELPRRPVTLAGVLQLCQELGAPVRRQ